MKRTSTGDLYEVQTYLDNGMLACYRLSAHDGMPIGSLVHLAIDEVE